VGTIRDSEDRVVWLTVGVALGAPLSAWLLSVGLRLGDYVGHSLPPGQLPYVFSKLAGLMAFCLLWLQCVFALGRGLPVLPRAGGRVHRTLGVATLGMALLHYGLFFAAASARGGGLAWELLVPNLLHGYYTLHVGLGIVALWLLLVGAYAGWRLSRGAWRWRAPHRVWIPIFALAFVHAYAIGSESRYGLMRFVFLSMGASTACLALPWLRERMSRRAAVPGRAQGGSP
jgi:hypothetical protein